MRLQVSVDALIVDVQLGVEAEAPRGDVEVAVRPKEVVQRHELGVVDLDAHVEVGARSSPDGRRRLRGSDPSP